MKINIFPSDSRGVAEHDWLHSRFSYSFAEYFNRNRVHFGALRVLNDDIVNPGKGFGMHPHDNMEIITIPLSGSLEHKDSMGNGSIIKTGDIQIMSAGTGVRHSEFNPSETEPVNLFQIWILPKERNIKPRYSQEKIAECSLYDNFQLVVSPLSEDCPLQINQDAWIHLGCFSKNTDATYQMKNNKDGLFVMVVKGEVETQGFMLNQRDAAEITEINEVKFRFNEEGEVLLIEVPMV